MLKTTLEKLSLEPQFKAFQQLLYRILGVKLKPLETILFFLCFVGFISYQIAYRIGVIISITNHM